MRRGGVHGPLISSRILSLLVLWLTLEDAMDRHAERFLSVFTDDEGMCVVDGLLAPEVGVALKRALDAASEALDDGRGRISAGSDGPEGDVAWYRADAIALMVERALATLDQRRRG